jgi:hypothetical protein
VPELKRAGVLIIHLPIVDKRADLVHLKRSVMLNMQKESSLQFVMILVFKNGQFRLMERIALKRGVQQGEELTEERGSKSVLILA